MYTKFFFNVTKQLLLIVIYKKQLNYSMDKTKLQIIKLYDYMDDNQIISQLQKIQDDIKHIDKMMSDMPDRDRPHLSVSNIRLKGMHIVQQILYSLLDGTLAYKYADEVTEWILYLNHYLHTYFVVVDRYDIPNRLRQIQSDFNLFLKDNDIKLTSKNIETYLKKINISETE